VFQVDYWLAEDLIRQQRAELARRLERQRLVREIGPAVAGAWAGVRWRDSVGDWLICVGSALKRPAAQAAFETAASVDAGCS
jgi:hypothetical protein